MIFNRGNTSPMAGSVVLRNEILHGQVRPQSLHLSDNQASITCWIVIEINGYSWDLIFNSGNTSANGRIIDPEERNLSWRTCIFLGIKQAAIVVRDCDLTCTEVNRYTWEMIFKRAITSTNGRISGRFYLYSLPCCGLMWILFELIGYEYSWSYYTWLHCTL